MLIEFRVCGQYVGRVDKNKVVASSKRYLRAHFDCSSDSEWECSKTALFNEYAVLLDENCECWVPTEVLAKPGQFCVSVFAIEDEKLITANKVIIPVLESGYVEGEVPADPTPDVYQQIIELEQKAVDVAQSVRAAADAGKFDGADGESSYEVAVRNGFIGTETEWLESLKGEDGEKGDKGDTGSQGIQGEKGDKGDTGAQGPQGEKGDKGDTGSQGEKGDQGEKGADGTDGADGYTPVRGTDYWTEEDKAEIVKETSEAIDLSSYVKDTDYATLNKAGVVMVGDGTNTGLQMVGSKPVTVASNKQQITGRTGGYNHISGRSYDLAVKQALSDNANAPNTGDFSAVWTDEEKKAARDLLGVTDQLTHYEQVKGNPAIIKHAVDLGSISVLGQSVQDGTPSPSAPIPIVNAAEETGEIKVTHSSKNLFNPTAQPVTFDFTPSYYSYPIACDLSKNQTLSIKLREGKSVPAGLYLGLAYRRNGGSVSASWLVSNGVYKMAATSTATTRTLDGLEGISISVYPQTIAMWEAAIDAFDIQFEYGSTVTDFEPYERIETATISCDGGLAGMPNADWYDEILLNRDGTGKHIQRIGKTEFDGTETDWQNPTTVQDGYSSYRISTFFSSINSVVPPADFMCSHFPCYPQSNYSSPPLTDKATSYNKTAQLIIVVSNEIADSLNQTDVTAWKSWLAEQAAAGTPVTIWYQLNTPIITEMTAEEVAEFMTWQVANGTNVIVNDSTATNCCVFRVKSIPTILDKLNG